MQIAVPNPRSNPNLQPAIRSRRTRENVEVSHPPLPFGNARKLFGPGRDLGLGIGDLGLGTWDS